MIQKINNGSEFVNIFLYFKMCKYQTWQYQINNKNQYNLNTF